MLDSQANEFRNARIDAEKSYKYNGAVLDGDSDDETAVCPSSTTEAKLMRKVDFRVIPMLCILYLLAFLDRVNIANANVFGLSTKKELNLTGHEYNTALVIFFVPYILFEIPSNVFLKKFRPHVWLSACMFAFGIITLCQGLVRNYHGLLATRALLGLAESGMFPGCFYVIGMWYKREEAQRRYSFFFCSTTLAGAFGGLLAAAIGKLAGKGGYAGWRWIFLLEGALTVVVSVAAFFLLPDFPEDAKWLNEEERAYISARLRVEQGRNAVERRITPKEVAHVFKDFKIFLGGFMYFGLIVPAYGYAYFAPGIIRTYGYSAIKTQLFSVPPWTAAFVFAMCIAFASDTARHRFIFTLIPIAVSIAGFAMLLSIHTHPHIEYGALFLVTSGTYSAMPVIVCWFNMNLGGHHRRSVGSAYQVAFGNIGGIIAVFSFLAKDSPRFTKGYAICISFASLSALSCIAYYVSCALQNRRRDRTPKNLGLTAYEKTELGDLGPDYRYLL